MSATTSHPDDWGQEPQRRAPERDIPTARDFLWTLADLMGPAPLYAGQIARLLDLKGCKERVSRSGGLYATLKALMSKGLVTYESDAPCIQGRYRITAAGFVAVERSPDTALPASGFTRKAVA